MSNQRLLIIDTDVGCDDALALLLAARDPNTKLIAVTTVFGNVTLDQATENARVLLPLFGVPRDQCTVHAGCAAPLTSTIAPVPWPGHGANGLGDAKFSITVHLHYLNSHPQTESPSPKPVTVTNRCAVCALV